VNSRATPLRRRLSYQHIKGGVLEKVEKIDEIPFDSQKKIHGGSHKR